MIRFKEFLTEGGNVLVGSSKASPIPMTAKTRLKTASDVHGMLSHLHDSFHKETGKHLFGPNKKALIKGSAYSGSTSHLFNKGVSDQDLEQHKPTLGDIDVKIPSEHADKLHQHLQPGKKFGHYTVVGSKKAGTEIHTLMKHKSGPIHQVDFEKTKYEHGEPTKGEVLSHSSDWEDTKKGIKGFHHKILLNAAGGEHHKFSPMYGLGSRKNPEKPGWTNDPEKITKTLFGKKADPNHIHSFGGVTHLIKNHIHPSEHQNIYNKFKESTRAKSGVDHTAALSYLRTHLGVK